MKGKTMNQEQKMLMAEVFGRIIGQIGYYKFMRKLGAPKYMAYFASTVSAHLTDMSNPLKPRVEKAFRR